MRLTVKIWKEGKWYIARCPELHVTTQGRTLTEAKRNLREATELQLECIIDYMIQHMGAGKFFRSVGSVTAEVIEEYIKNSQGEWNFDFIDKRQKSLGTF